MGLREEGTARALPPSSSPQAIPRPEDPTTPTGHGMPGVFRSLSPQEILQAMSDAENPHEDGGDRCSQSKDGRLNRTLTTGEGSGGPSKIQSGRTPGHFSDQGPTG